MPKGQKSQLHHNEWSYFLNADKVDDRPLNVEISADEKQRKDIAVRANIVSVDSIEADFTLDREQAGRVVHAAGRFKAVVTLECSVSAENFSFSIEEPVQGWFEDKERTVSFMKALKERDSKGNASQKGPVEVEMASEEEDPEGMVNGYIDLGELVVQHLILAIPPYPRKEGVEYDITDESVKPEKDSPLRKNPFEALKDWKERR